MHPRVETYLDILATISLAVGVAFTAVMFADLFKSRPDTIGTHPNYLQGPPKAAVFLGLLSAPTIFSAISWPIYLRQKYAGGRVFGGLPFVVIISALWSYAVYVAVTDL